MPRLIIGSLFLLSACATSTAVQVPDGLQVPAGQQLALEAHATGVQIYQCKAKSDDPSKFEWALKAPEADLTGADGKLLGKHYAGPTWESTDGSKVVGQVKAKNPGRDATAIPWLLLDAKSTSGDGIFTKTTAIQRLDTVGGKAPADGCTPDNPDKEARISYQARYLFYR